MASRTVSIIIPAFNEVKRLPQTLDRLSRYSEAAGLRAEVLVVDDGSSDGTARAVSPPAKVLRNESNHGKGYAVRQGILAATGEFRVFMDADLSVPPEYLQPLLRMLEEGHDVVIGSRSVSGARVVATSRGYRRTMGHVFNRLVRIFAVGGVHDTQCGFKGFRASAATKLFSRQKLDGFAFDVEILYLAQRMGLRIAELPVEWLDSETTKIRPVVDSAKMLVDLLRVRWLHRSEDGA
ncbi:MAG: glycosyltransferase family 2 protein [Planctomycetes bacterium]|nr:glycosyltransferase family 2 protein [Planctomycetota bacterium]